MPLMYLPLLEDFDRASKYSWDWCDTCLSLSSVVYCMQVGCQGHLWFIDSSSVMVLGATTCGTS
ncbi:hypothetical protein Taro_026503 [Colocasia esculenta]|uniref:Uncharacterized protein n=1 Tax=Colocasia esculenta TaxID=4460 RepID=A0A843VFD8_COLES|nr:hypothetical protein [Colocasia esculenta]